MKPTFNILIVLVVLMFTACTTDITLNLKGTAPELVVDGVITTDTTAHIIQLKKNGRLLFKSGCRDGFGCYCYT